MSAQSILNSLLIFVPLLSLALPVTAQQRESHLTLQASAGAYMFDKNLGLQRSPSFGVSVGRGLTSFFKVEVEFALSSTHQKILGAASQTRLNVRTYHYFMTAQLSKSLRAIRKIQPFLTLGLGGLLLAPRAVDLPIGGGETVRVEPAPDHKTSLKLGGGLSYSIGKRLSLSVKYQKIFFRIKVLTNSGANSETMTAANDYLGIGLTTALN